MRDFRFNTAISFACSGLPANAICSFSPSTLTPAGNTAATTTLTLATGVKTGAVLQAPTQTMRRGVASAVALAMLFLPWTMLHRRGRTGIKRIAGLSALLVLTGALAALSGCGGGPSNATPEGSSTVTVTATAGSSTQTATMQLTVN